MTDIKFPPRSWEDLVGILTHVAGMFTLAEFLLAAICVLLAFAVPRLGSRGYERIERRLAALANNPTRQILAVGLLAIAARAAILPWVGAPVPIVFDEQSIVLQAQTLAAGRLSNPTHPLWEHFETFYVNQIPAYASMYFPGRGAPLAAGLLVADHAWVGVWLSVVLMCMAAVWMLQGWVSLPMALLGGVLVVARLGVFSFWINSYYGGAFTALGAMLVFGALPRILREPWWRHGALMGLGAVILMTTRPYEGALVCLPVALVLLAHLVKPAWQAGRLAFLKVALPATLLVGAGGALLVAYNLATTGDSFKTAYDLQRETYASAPAFLISPPIKSENRGPEYFRTYYTVEASYYHHRDSPIQLVRSVLGKLFDTWNFYIGATFTITFLAGLWSSRRDYFLLGTLVFFSAGYCLVTWNFPQYTAPLYPVLLIFIMRGLQWLRTYEVSGRPVGLFLSRAIPTAAIALLVLPITSLAFGTLSMQSGSPHAVCCTTSYYDLRLRVVRQLTTSPGRHLVLVKDGPQNPVTYEMVYNDADIDNSEVVWAHRLSEEKDLRLQNYFAERRVWEFEWRPETGQGYVLRPLNPVELQQQ